MYIGENILSAWFICILIEVLQKNTFGFLERKILPQKVKLLVTMKYYFTVYVERSVSHF